MGTEKKPFRQRRHRPWAFPAVFLILTAFATAASPIPGESLPAPASQDDAVAFAISEIERLDVYWTRPFYAATELTYRFAAPIAMSGGGYILLQSPKLAVRLVSGGVVGMAGGVAEDFVLHLIESAVKTPSHVCRGIIKATIDEGWAEYKQAYEIVRKFRQTGVLSRRDALEFLRGRYGPDKMTLARVMRERMSTADYSISRTAADEAARDVMSRFADAYQGELGIDRKLPLVAAALFIKDLMEILEAKRAGLAAYVPYQRYAADMEKIHISIIEEIERFSTVKPRPAAKPAPAASAASPDKKDFFKVLPNAQPPRVGPFRIGMTWAEVRKAAREQNLVLVDDDSEYGGPRISMKYLKTRADVQLMTFLFSGEREDYGKDKLPESRKLNVIRINHPDFATDDNISVGATLGRVKTLLGPVKVRVYQMDGFIWGEFRIPDRPNFDLVFEKSFWDIYSRKELDRLLDKYDDELPIDVFPADLKIGTLIIRIFDPTTDIRRDLFGEWHHVRPMPSGHSSQTESFHFDPYENWSWRYFVGLAGNGRSAKGTYKIFVKGGKAYMELKTTSSDYSEWRLDGVYELSFKGMRKIVLNGKEFYKQPMDTPDY